jgi:hypothetical protein
MRRTRARRRAEAELSAGGADPVTISAEDVDALVAAGRITPADRTNPIAIAQAMRSSIMQAQAQP